MGVELKYLAQSLTYLVTDEDHVGKLAGGQNCDIHLTFSGLRLQRIYATS